MFEYDSIGEFLKSFFSSRLFVLSAVVILLGTVLLQRVFQLQIINGETYQENYTLLIQKEKVLPATRGNIYDRNGMLLAYNKLAYKITIEDNGFYEDSDEKNEKINTVLAEIISVLEKNGDAYTNDFGILLKSNGKYAFQQEGTALQRFRADVYGEADAKNLGYNKSLGYDTSTATEEQVIKYLCKSYGLLKKPYANSKELQYKVLVMRYALAQNSYQKYISTTLAANVSNETMAYIEENKDHLQGVQIEEDYIREYAKSEYFASMIGYTGKISTEEYEKLSETNDGYSLTDIIGKAGIEQVMDEYLQGKKGSQTLYVDNVGREITTTDYVEPTAGNSVYLSIDGKLQVAVYDLLEQELAGILYSKIVDAKETAVTLKASDLSIAVYDAYFSLINNNVIRTSHFTDNSASSTEKQVQQAFENRLAEVLARLQSQFVSETPETYTNATKEYQSYYSYIVSMLKSQKIILTDKIDTSNPTYIAWTNDETISLKDFLNYCITAGWIDYNVFQAEDEYSDSSEIYSDLVRYILETIASDDGFEKRIYEYLIQQDVVTGRQLCLILFDQKVLKKDPASYEGLNNGTVSSYSFLKNKIRDLEITPAQLALDPCTASCVITNTRTGELLACVSYPGYDNNRMANTVDADYFASMQSDHSEPLYNHATQERTAPGSTFKMVTATAGLTEGIIVPSTKITCTGQFQLLDNKPKCWIYPGAHGALDVSKAIGESCNGFFYQVGYDLSMAGGSYSDSAGINKLSKYALEYGLGDKTGIEIPEYESQVADEFPVMAAIGQSNHNYTTIQLARYVTAVANKGTVYNYTLLNRVENKNGKVIKKFKPSIKNTMDNISESTWNAIHEGNLLVTQGLDAFRNFQISVGGKTGTAQQVMTRGNHALFVGYAPFENPKISIATRIAFGYTSHNAADVSAQILKYYFKLSDQNDLLNGQARDVSNGQNIGD